MAEPYSFFAFIMSSTSQNFPRTFYRLSKTWDAKTGTRTFKDPIWSITSSTKNEPISMIPAMMTKQLGNLPDMMVAFEQVGLMERRGDQVWIYDMRQSDVLPKSTSDLERLYSFVQAAIPTWFSKSDADYLLNHSHIAVCFFVWYFTKPNFFFKDKVMKQTTRHGIQRVWSPFFLIKQPKLVISQAPSRADSKQQLMTTTDVLLPKQQGEQEKLRTNIAKIISDSGGDSIDWEDPRRIHLAISEAIANEDKNFSIKQTKKLQNLYNDYTKITSKINDTLRKRAKVEFANSKIAKAAAIESAEDDLGPPPDSPPILIRQSASLGEEGWCVGCDQNQPNQQAHEGGCLPDPIDDDVPDSWEDL